MNMNFPEIPYPHCPLCKLFTLLGEQALSAEIVIKLQNSNLIGLVKYPSTDLYNLYQNFSFFLRTKHFWCDMSLVR